MPPRKLRRLCGCLLLLAAGLGLFDYEVEPVDRAVAEVRYIEASGAQPRAARGRHRSQSLGRAHCQPHRTAFAIGAGKCPCGLR